MPKVRTTIEPTKEIEVTEEEYTDLERQGLLLKSNATTEAGLTNAAVNQTTEKKG